MPVESFDETTSVNGPVSKTGTQSPAQPTNPPKSAGLPKAVKTADGTENIRAEGQTKQASPLSTPSGGKRKYPEGVTSYDDGST